MQDAREYWKVEILCKTSFESNFFSGHVLFEHLISVVLSECEQIWQVKLQNFVLFSFLNFMSFHFGDTYWHYYIFQSLQSGMLHINSLLRWDDR